MRRFQHGIWLAFLRPVGACFGLLIKQEDEEAKNAALLPTIKGRFDKEDDDGCLLPLSGENEGVLLPTNGEDETAADSLDLHQHDKGTLPPTIRGDDANDAVTIDLQPSFNVQEDAEHGGDFQPVNKDADGVLSPMLGINKAKAFLQATNVSFQLHGMHVFCDAYSLKIIVITYMHASLWENPIKACMVHNDVVIVHAKPRVDPKVKKKTSLLLCLFIDMPFHPGEYGHDGNPPNYHNDPYSYPSLYNKTSFPPVNTYPHLSSTSDFSLLIILSNEDKEAYDVLEGATTSIELPFIPLRGREGYQAHERNFKSENPHAALKTKTMVMKMRLFYINKDLLDPG